ncbi:MAG: M23 family metallopeptidase [Alphaproteobacteria bacterium]|nr:M23 family metallopeptidase [Alphaproteobacteria bacterium]
MAKVQFGFARANSLTKQQIAPLLLVGIVAWSVGTFGHFYVSPLSVEGEASIVAENNASSINTAAQVVVAQVEESAPVQAAVAVGNVAAAAVAPKPENVTRQIELDGGESFGKMLGNADIDEKDASAVVAALNKIYDVRKLKAGQEVNLAFIRRGTEETLQSVNFQPELTKEITIARIADDKFDGKVKTTPIERKRMAARGEIRTSLYEAGRREDVPNNIMAALIRVYSHAIDFQRDIRSGDRFEVLYDQPMAKDGTPVGDGTIIYAALEVGGKVKPLYRVTFGDGTVDYFDAKGQSIKRALLKTPVDGARVTSSYGMRMHPLLGYSKMHKGMDFGATTGTPIFAAGSGVIEEVGFKGSYGRYIRIQHNGRTKTAYGHMSRFARGIYQGARVNQGDVIGFVGSSGRSTGPHLHFEVIVDNKQTNPMSVNMPTGRVLEGTALTQFKQGETRIRQEFSSLLSNKSGGGAVIPASSTEVVRIGKSGNQQPLPSLR